MSFFFFDFHDGGVSPVEFFLFVDALLILLRHHIIIIKFSSNISTWQPSCCNHFEMEWSIHIVPNSCFVYSISKWQEMVVCMGQRNGTIPSKQAPSV